jgi:hypothetical protein
MTLRIVASFFVCRVNTDRGIPAMGMDSIATVATAQPVLLRSRTKAMAMASSTLPTIRNAHTYKEFINHGATVKNLSQIESLGLDHCCRPLSSTPLLPCLRRLHRLIALIGFAGNLTL